jgi:putative Ig domain-containing protein
MPFHSGELGLAYTSVTLGATGGVPAYYWSFFSGAFPAGLGLSTGGVVSGSVTKPGTFTFAVRVSDTAGGTAIGKATVVVYSALATTETCATKCVIGKGCTKCGTFGTVSKGLSPYTYKLVGGAVPKGMTWSGLALKGGFPAGNYAMSVQVTDKLGAHVQVDGSWSIYNPATLLKGRTSDCINNIAGATCTATWGYSGGSPSAVPTLVITKYSQYCDANGCYPVPTGPPPGWSVSMKSGVITISVSSPDCVVNYTANLTLVLRDPSTCATTLSSNAGTMLVDYRVSC